MSVELIALDLDRTLLRTDKSLSQYTVDVLQKCRDKGIKIVFATARPKRSILGYMEQFNADAVILHNGAMVLENDKVLSYHGIPPITAKRILLSILKFNPKLTLSVEIMMLFMLILT